MRACRIINGDSVFWLRRTDSLSYHAKVLATSGNAEKINDFKLLDAIDICSKKVSFDNYLWSPDKNDPEKQITFFWENNQTIQLVKLYGNIEEANRVCKFKISFDTYTLL